MLFARRAGQIKILSQRCADFYCRQRMNIGAWL